MSLIGEQEKSTKPRTPTQPLDFSETKSSQPKDKTFRFKPHQKAFLEAEAATNGFCPDVERREQLALVLGVEEKSVRVGDLQAQ
jgi:hypothetical protein